jgi:hypothetical protein
MVVGTDRLGYESHEKRVNTYPWQSGSHPPLQRHLGLDLLVVRPWPSVPSPGSDRDGNTAKQLSWRHSFANWVYIATHWKISGDDIWKTGLCRAPCRSSARRNELGYLLPPIGFLTHVSIPSYKVPIGGFSINRFWSNSSWGTYFIGATMVYCPISLSSCFGHAPWGRILNFWHPACFELLCAIPHLSLMSFDQKLAELCWGGSIGELGCWSRLAEDSDDWIMKLEFGLTSSTIVFGVAICSFKVVVSFFTGTTSFLDVRIPPSNLPTSTLQKILRTSGIRAWRFKRPRSALTLTFFLSAKDIRVHYIRRKNLR